MDPSSQLSLVAYTLRNARGPTTWKLYDTEHIVSTFDSGVRYVATAGRLRQDPLDGGSVVLQDTPGGVVVVVNCPADFCAYRFVGRTQGHVLRQWEDTGMCVYPFDAWTGSTHTESVRSASAGTAIVLWCDDSLYITATVCDADPPADSPTARVDETPGSLLEDAHEELLAGDSEARVAADLLTEVLDQVQLGPASSFEGCARGAQ
ncbi:nuclear protein UL4 [Saimiriine alphaherpesvirus 1]|uniref:Nuclear protein UL4 n=1 Tax=Saimiriine herpesvirus 1 (strain MV-5-4-PSL) TaxID=10353 RepID=E2IUG6_SHV1|nr:nuclear protein UL4 [Saimiriine alphaherpesvirus 1]ADO13824.1 nuclear protein UL4 [Saimiriine alphaherpesvirus 1]